MNVKSTYVMLCCMLPFWVKSQPMEEYNTKVREVIVICKTHFDIGYTHRVNDVVNYYQTEMIDRAFKVMDASR